MAGCHKCLRVFDTVRTVGRRELSRFVRLAIRDYYFSRPTVRVSMPHRPHRETTIERLYREVTGRKMPLSVRRILLRKRKPRRT
jgi:hypothetical protein